MMPFALELFRRHLEGESVDALARETGIPAHRIQEWLTAAAAYMERWDERRKEKLARGGSN